MTSAELNAFLNRPLEGVLGANRVAGGPQLTVMWYYWDGARFYFSTTRDRSKYPNLKRDPAISFIVNDPATRGYITAYGQAELIEENVRELTRPIMQKYMPPTAVDKWESEPMDPQRIIIALRPDKIVSR